MSTTDRPTILPTHIGDEALGTNIGRYKVLEQIGEGGFGVVYVAEQKEPVKRRVALKVIKLGMDTRQVVARFEAERQALALMDHPNIAKVLDAGATESGRPYFVMELVRGVKITEYCDQHKLAPKQRLELFIQVCQAIQHAHQKGIIHRDIKPSNILVTLHDGVPVPKVIDFGIAKATQQDLTDKTVYTQLQQFIGTPAYMSPEQAEMSGLDIDTRSDIYSLGVLLYELLTGRTPFDPRELMQQGLDAMRKTIREKQPLRPSTKVATLRGDELSTTAAYRSAEGVKLINLLRGDLDWIVMKCLEKDRTRRYETANAVAMDIKRFFNHEIVVARPPSRLYEFQKTVMRHKVGFATTAAIMVFLTVGVLVSAWQAARARRAEKAALAAQASESDQRKEAEASRRKAVEAQANEAKLRQQADAQALVTRKRAYASDMNLVQQALARDNLARAQMLLQRQVPAAGEIDLRGWEWRYLWDLARPDDHQVLGTYDSRVGSLAFSGDGRLLKWHADGKTTVMDLISRRKVFEQSTLRRTAFAHKSPLLAFTETSSTNALHLYDLAAQRDTMLPCAVTYLPMWQEFSPDDQTLVSVLISPRDPENPPLWKLAATKSATGETLWEQPIEMPRGGAWVNRLDISPDGAAVAVSVSGSQVTVFEMKDGRERFRIKTTDELPMVVRFSPDSSVLLTTAGYGDPVIRLWNASDGQPLGTLEGHHRYVTGLVFTPDHRKLISSSGDYTIRIWDWVERRPLLVLRGHLDEVDGLALSPDGRTLASNSKDGAIYLWDLTQIREHTGPRTFATSSPSTGFEFTTNGNAIVELRLQAPPRFWDTSSLQPTDSPVAVPTNSFAVALSPDAAQVALVSFPLLRGSIRDVFSGREITNLTAPEFDPSTVLADGRAAYSKDGHLLAHFFLTKAPQSAGVTNIVNLHFDTWATDTWGLSRHEMPFPDEEISAFPVPAAVPGSFAVVGRRVITLVDLRQNQRRKVQLLAGKDFPIAGFAISPDCAHAAAVSEDGYVWIWDWKTLELIKRFKAFVQGGHSIAFSPDNRRLAVGSDVDEAVKLWDTDTWDELLTLAGKGSLFGSLQFSPNGQFLFGVNAAGLAHLWRAPSWDEIAAAQPSPNTR